MNRKQRIIVSVTGIFLVLLILVGVTYAYFLTKINGNTNDKSISVTTANLILKYDDINDILISENAVEPGKSWVKTFSATNKGNKAVTYGVALENLINTLERTEDLVYTLECKQYLKNGYTVTDKVPSGTISGTCNGIEETEFPTLSSIIVQNTIDDDKVQAYTLTVTYKEANTNQSVDMGKQFSAKVNIVDPNTFGAYGTGTLASTIISSAQKDGENRTVWGTSEIPTTYKTTETERLLNSAPDDYGISYYFRGNPIDNYVEYAGMCWRIVRIQGDGSTKLILASELTCSSTNLTDDSGYATDGNPGIKGQKLTAHYGYKLIGTLGVNDYLNSEEDTTNSLKVRLQEWLDKKVVEKHDISLLKKEKWCIGDQTTAYSFLDNGEIIGKTNELLNLKNSFEYSAGNRFYATKTPSYKCDKTDNDGEIDVNIISVLTMDEIVYAGGGSVENANYFLNNNALTNYWWSLSATTYSANKNRVSASRVWPNGKIANCDVKESQQFRPSIILVSSTKVTSGNGTSSTPYKVS